MRILLIPHQIIDQPIDGWIFRSIPCPGQQPNRVFAGEATETFVYRITNESALLAGYHINSNALIIK